MFKKNEKTENHINQDNTQQIKQFYSMPELKQLIMRDISVLDDALAISGENTQLAYHISKQKGFANKYFGCTYKTNDEDFCVVSLPKMKDSFGKILTAFEPKDAENEEQGTKDETSTENLDKIKQTNEEINKTLDESEELLDAVTNYWASMNNKREGVKIEERGDGWTKQVIGGRLELVYDKPKVLTRAKAEDIKTGVIHTYDAFMSAKDPIEYLSSIQVGDEIRIKYKGKNCDMAQGIVASIQTTERAFAPTKYEFVLHGYGKITHKDFA